MAKPEVRFTPSDKMMGYLRLLVRDTLLGKSVNDVAEKLLTVEVERRFLEGYHAKAVPILSAEALEADQAAD